MRDDMEVLSMDHEAFAGSDAHETDHVGTVEVQILLSWFFEGTSHDEMAIDMPRAA